MLLLVLVEFIAPEPVLLSQLWRLTAYAPAWAGFFSNLPVLPMFFSKSFGSVLDSRLFSDEIHEQGS